MNQSAILSASLLAAFGLFIASRERLPVYARILWGDKPASHSEQPQEGGETSGDQSDEFTFGDLFRPFGYLDALPDVPEIPDFNWNILQ